MCLITIANQKRPTLEEMQKAHRTNSDGMGVAWRDGKHIRFIKGMEDVEAVHKLCSKLPMPFVIHYRMASVGSKSKELCHPFPLTTNVELVSKGKVDEVLFHNGHMSDWKKPLALLAVSRNESLPDGEWSDTRSVAWIVARLGETYLAAMEGKWVHFSKNTCMMYGGGWDEEGKGEIYHSNSYWKSSGYVTNYCGWSPSNATKDFHKKKRWEKDKEEKIALQQVTSDDWKDEWKFGY